MNTCCFLHKMAQKTLIFLLRTGRAKAYYASFRRSGAGVDPDLRHSQRKKRGAAWAPRAGAAGTAFRSADEDRSLFIKVVFRGARSVVFGIFVVGCRRRGLGLLGGRFGFRRGRFRFGRGCAVGLHRRGCSRTRSSAARKRDRTGGERRSQEQQSGKDRQRTFQGFLLLSS